MDGTALIALLLVNLMHCNFSLSAVLLAFRNWRSEKLNGWFMAPKETIASLQPLGGIFPSHKRPNCNVYTLPDVLYNKQARILIRHATSHTSGTYTVFQKNLLKVKGS
jgi:hypothetical protein